MRKSSQAWQKLCGASTWPQTTQAAFWILCEKAETWVAPGAYRKLITFLATRFSTLESWNYAASWVCGIEIQIAHHQWLCECVRAWAGALWSLRKPASASANLFDSSPSFLQSAAIRALLEHVSLRIWQGRKLLKNFLLLKVSDGFALIILELHDAWLINLVIV